MTSVLRKGDTEAAELAGLMTVKLDKPFALGRPSSQKAVVKSRKANRDTTRGQAYSAWQNGRLNKKASRYICEHASVKGKANLTATSFCQWVNETLLPNET